MLLQGSIHRFNLADVLQFLAQKAATGVLEVGNFEESGFVYLVEGRIEGISLPVMHEKLGTRLLRAGYLSQQQLAEALMEDPALPLEQKRLKPLGQRLIEKGFTCEARIREIMREQILDELCELAHWRNGVFIYRQPEQMPHFQVAVHGDVQELLLDAQRRVDESEQARKTGNGLGSEACHVCPLCDECAQAVKAKSPHQDHCLWRKLIAELDDYNERLGAARQLHRSNDENAKAALDA
jgi:hypothetical protein